MNVDTFEYLLEKLRPIITKKTTNMRKPISPEEQLAVSLRFYATGASFDSLMFQFRISAETIGRIILRVSWAIICTLMEEWMPFPQTPADWEKIADGFEKKWNFPNCVGAVDGKHVSIRRPSNSVSKYINYKGFYSIILMAVVDADYKFLNINVGSQGRLGDGNVFKESSFYRKMVTSTLNLPCDKSLPGDER